MATKKQVTSAVATPAVDVAALLQMVQQLQQQVAAGTKVSVQAKTVEKPKASFDAKALVASLAGKPGVIEERTKKGRRKLTAFCDDGAIVSVIV